ncbi:hypothetical protein [Metabacillus iocasae]|uniref:Uncharacterized protein n=1 Tax=Priestia iocasae TaxID=2291674 RepID=A0ABS2QU27_9BACI|nr:hypothetical protein [Metabacillus iocasae]MBM7702803.1 hypothetical protein [Metabacillus iocasae]
MWIVLIGGLLGLGFVIDLVAKKRKINLDPEEGIKHTSESERVYVETHLHNTRQGNDTNGPTL